MTHQNYVKSPSSPMIVIQRHGLWDTTDLSIYLKKGNCAIIGEKSKGKKLWQAVCVELMSETSDIYVTSVDKNFKSYHAFNFIEEQSKNSKPFFIIEDCHNNIEEVHDLLDLVDKTQYLANEGLLLTSKESETDKKLFPESWHVVDVGAREKNLEEKTLIEESILKSITSETLREYEKEGQEIFQELEEYKVSYGVSSEEYLEHCNDEAFIADLPEWKHLFMKGYGSFPRPVKENQILGDIDRNIERFNRKKNGLLLHVISGDSGCGKSALVKLVLRRLIDKQNLEQFHHLSEILSWIRIFELGAEKDWGKLEKAVSMKFRQASEGNEFLHIVYFDDDLFDLEKEEIDKLLGIFKRASDNLQIYFLTTSPSWIFSKGDLSEYRKKFGLIASKTTPIGGLDDDDRQALKKQYQTMYGEACRSDLLELIDSKEETLILLKLALHQNLNYSEYLKSMFHKLEAKHPEYLAALLLSSTLARFYVHTSITLIQELNQDLPPQDRLPDASYFYEDFNQQGLRLFRIRTGTLSKTNPAGLPDTIAPFHDRVAQVIYETWPTNKEVPVFGCKLWELKDKVYLKLNKSPQTRPILANVFRGYLRVDPENELSTFVNGFGPVQQNIWALLDEPDATYRWITYSKYDIRRNKELLNHWERTLNRMAKKDAKKATKAYLALFLLNPRKMPSLEDLNWIRGVPDLDEKYSFMLLPLLDELLSQKYLVEPLIEYLHQIEKWLVKFSPTDRSSISYRYFVLSALTRGLQIQKIKTEISLNNALAQIIKSYFININYEYITNYLISNIKIGLSKQIEWTPSDLKDMSTSLFDYIQIKEYKFRPVLFEQFLYFIRSGEIEDFPEEQILDIYWKICIQNSGFEGLTYTSQDLFEHLKWINQKNHSQFRKIVTEMFDSLTEGKLNQFMQSTAYPDFLSRFLKTLSLIHHEINGEQLLTLLRPMVADFYNPQQTRYVFGEVKKLACSDLQHALLQVEYNTDRQIRLCLAKEMNLSLDLVLKDFTELLEEGGITIPTYLCDVLTSYLKTKKKSEVSEVLLEDYRRRIYAWLRQNDDKDESASVLELIETDILFSDNLKRFERIVEHAIQVGRIPFWYLEWWLKEEAAKVSAEQRYSVLDAFWSYALRISNEEINGEFVAYNQYFLFLLDKYRIGQDPAWWGRAVQRLLEFYNQLVTRNFLKPRQIKKKGRWFNESTMSYKQRLCLDQMMESILRSSSLLEETPRTDFIKRVEEGLKPYTNQFWASRWITQLNPKTDIDGTRLFLDYLSSIEGQPQGIQFEDILNQSNRWFEWVKASNREISTELTQIWRWLDRAHPPTVSIFLIPALLKICPENLHYFEIGNLVKNVLKNVKFNFKSKSMIIGNYLEFLKIYDEKKKYKLSEQEVKTLKDILIWFLREVDSQIDTTSAVYGLQNVFQAALEYEIDIGQTEVENTFFRVLETQIKHKESGGLAKHYFAWLLHQNGEIKISQYISWIETHYQEVQTPYVLMHLISSLSKNSSIIKPTTDEIEQIWSATRLLIANRLENEGTTVAAQDFMRLCHQKTLSIDGNKLNEILADSYHLCLQMSDHERVIYLLINFWDQFLLGHSIHYQMIRNKS